VLACISVHKGDYGFSLTFTLVREDGSAVEIPDGATISFVLTDFTGKQVNSITGTKIADNDVMFNIPSGFFDVDAGRYYGYVVLETDSYRETSNKICIDVWE